MQHACNAKFTTLKQIERCFFKAELSHIDNFKLNCVCGSESAQHVLISNLLAAWSVAPSHEHARLFNRYQWCVVPVKKVSLGWQSNTIYSVSLQLIDQCKSLLPLSTRSKLQLEPTLPVHPYYLFHCLCSMVAFLHCLLLICLLSFSSCYMHTVSFKKRNSVFTGGSTLISEDSVWGNNDTNYLIY